MRIPFDQFDNPRNYLSKVQNYPKVYDNVNSLSHRGDFVAACLDLWQKRAPFGTYNLTNPGFVSTRQVVAMIQRILKPARPFEFWAGRRGILPAGRQNPALQLRSRRVQSSWPPASNSARWRKPWPMR